MDPVLENMAALGAYQQIIIHVEQGVSKDHLEEDSEHCTMKSDIPNPIAQESWLWRMERMTKFQKDEETQF